MVLVEPLEALHPGLFQLCGVELAVAVGVKAVEGHVGHEVAGGSGCGRGNEAADDKTSEQACHGWCLRMGW